MFWSHKNKYWSHQIIICVLGSDLKRTQKESYVLFLLSATRWQHCFMMESHNSRGPCVKLKDSHAETVWINFHSLTTTHLTPISPEKQCIMNHGNHHRVTTATPLVQLSSGSDITGNKGHRRFFRKACFGAFQHLSKHRGALNPQWVGRAPLNTKSTHLLLSGELLYVWLLVNYWWMSHKRPDCCTQRIDNTLCSRLI